MSWKKKNYKIQGKYENNLIIKKGGIKHKKGYVLSFCIILVCLSVLY